MDSKNFENQLIFGKNTNVQKLRALVF